MTFARNVVTLAGGTAVAHVANVAAMPVLSRLFTPDAFGVFGLLLSVTTILGTIAGLRYELAIVLPRDREEATHLLILSVLLAVLTSAATAAVLSANLPAVADRVHAANLKGWIYLVPIVMLIVCVQRSLCMWQSRQRRFGSIAAARVIQSVGTQLGAIAFGLLNLVNGGYLMIARIGAFMVSILFLLRAAFGRPLTIRADFRTAGMLASAGRYSDFPKYAVWSSLLVAASLEMPVLGLSLFFSMPVVGHFVLTAKILRLPYNFVGDSINQVLYKEASARQGEKAGLSHIIGDISQRLVALSMFPLLSAGVVGQELFSAVLGSEWSVSGKMALTYCLAALVEFNLAPFNCLFNVFEEQKMALFFNLALMCLRAAFLSLGVLVFNDPLITVGLYAVGDSLGRLIKFRWILNRAGYPLKRLLRSAVRLVPVTLALLAGLVTLKAAALSTFFFLAGYVIVTGVYMAWINAFHVNLFSLLDEARSA